MSSEGVMLTSRPERYAAETRVSLASFADRLVSHHSSAALTNARMAVAAAACPAGLVPMFWDVPRGNETTRLYFS
jgi:hypothetical protein